MVIGRSLHSTSSGSSARSRRSWAYVNSLPASRRVHQRSSSTSRLGVKRVVVGRRHDPVADDLRSPLRVVVPGLARRVAELAAVAGLLLDLAEGGVLVALSGLVLALGERSNRRTAGGGRGGRTPLRRHRRPGARCRPRRGPRRMRLHPPPQLLALRPLPHLRPLVASGQGGEVLRGRELAGDEPGARRCSPGATRPRPPRPGAHRARPGGR